jgi:hypothetical protein
MRLFQVAPILLILLAFTGGCKDAEPPETVAKEFYRLCEFARQNGFEVVQRPLLEILTVESIANLEQCATRLNERVGSEERFTAKDCLVFQVFTGKRKKFESRRIHDSEDKVRLAVVSGDSERLLELVEADGWKIDLIASLALNE